MFQYPFPSWDKVLWVIVLGSAVTLEFLGIFQPQDATLTRLIKASIPVWGRAMILGWLAYHFLIQK